MGESGKAVLALVMIVGVLGGIFAWMLDTVNWPARLGFPAAGVASLGLLLWAMTRKNKAPDLLGAKCRTYFERVGFCFAVVPAVTDRSARLDIYFQNRYARPCRAQVVLQPSQQFFLNRRKVGSFTVEIECEGGAFGAASLPWGVPESYQGKEQSFDVAAHVKYPTGHGTLLRFKDGIHVGDAKTNWAGILTAAAAATGTIVISKPARLKIKLPSNVDETVPDDAPILVQTLWRPGDPWSGGKPSKAESKEPASSALHGDAELAS
jgi:hypothetical protein